MVGETKGMNVARNITNNPVGLNGKTKTGAGTGRRQREGQRAKERGTERGKGGGGGGTQRKGGRQEKGIRGATTMTTRTQTQYTQAIF